MKNGKLVCVNKDFLTKLLIGWWPAIQLPVEYIDGLAQERRNPIANALDLRLSCTHPSILCWTCYGPPLYHIYILNWDIL